MNEDQHRRRIALWLGSFPAIAAFVLLTLVLLLSNRTPLENSQIPVGSSPPHQVEQSTKATSIAIELVQADSP